VALRPRQMGTLPLLYPILKALGVRQTVNELVSTGEQRVPWLPDWAGVSCVGQVTVTWQVR